MSKKRFRVAVIGAGMISNAGHIPAWKNLADDVDLVGVADVAEERAQGTAQRHGIPHAYGDWRKMLSELEPDIVSITTPNQYHKEATIEALKAGANVLCEKPITTNYADAVQMFETAKMVGKTLMVGQSSRFSNATMAAKQFAVSGQLGDMYFAETSTMRRRGIPTWGVFHMKAHSGGGPIYDLGVHMLDSLLWILGNPRVVAVSAIANNRLTKTGEQLITTLGSSGAPIGVYYPRPYDASEFDVEDFAAAFLRLETGGAIACKVSWAANIPAEGISDTLILGTKAGLRLNPLTLYSSLGHYMADYKPLVPPDMDVPFAGHWGETAHFVRFLRGEEELIVKPEEVLNVMRALDALYLSAEKGCEVRLDQ